MIDYLDDALVKSLSRWD